MIRHYESVVVIDGTLTQDATDEQNKKIDQWIASHGGTVEKKDVWGKRKLAYSIKKKNYGTYVYLEFNIDGKEILELRKSLEINESILRNYIQLGKNGKKKNQEIPRAQPA